MADNPYSSTATFQEGLIVDILPVINIIINRTTPGWDSVNKDGATIGAEAIEVSLQTGENRGTGFRLSTEKHPLAGSIRIEKLKLSSVDLIGSLGITGHLLQGTKGAAHAVADAFEAENKSITGSFKDTLERVFFSSDGTGKLGTVTAIDVSRAKLTLNPQDMLYVTEGENIQLLAATATPTEADAFYKVVSVNYPTNSITVTPAVAAGVVVGLGVYNHMSKDKEFMGLNGGVGDARHIPASGGHGAGIFQTKDRASSQYFSATVMEDLVDALDATKGQFTPNDFRGIMNVMQYQKRRKPDCFWTTIPISDAYEDYVGEKINYVNVSIVDSSIKTVAFDNVPIRKSIYVPFGTIFAIDQSSFKFHPLAKGTGAIVFLGQGQDGMTIRKRQDYDIYDSHLILRGQIGFNNPWANVRYYCNNANLAKML